MEVHAFLGLHGPEKGWKCRLRVERLPGGCLGLAVRSVQFFYRRQGALRKVASGMLMVVLASFMLFGFGMGLGVGLWSSRHDLPDEKGQGLTDAYTATPIRESQSHTTANEETRRLRALSINLGAAEARLTRLEALGKRLVDLGGLDKKEFDLDNAPALGGPEECLPEGEGKGQQQGSGVMQTQSPALGRMTPTDQQPDSLDIIEEAIASLQRRAERRDAQLNALEGLLAMRSLHQAMHPAGSPLSDTWIASPYGMRRDPFTGRLAFHAGYDLEARTGEPVSAVAEGVVVRAERSGAYGLLVEINHGGGFRTRYGHNSKLLVQVGEKVLRGQVVALAGSTGRSTGPHVHFEVLFNDKPINPISFLRDKG